MAGMLLSANYTIKRVLELNQFLNVYAAEKKNTETVMPVIINEICNRELLNRWIIDLAELKKSGSPDFVEYFSEDAKLYAVFSYTSGKNIKKYLEMENLNISYRMVLFKHMLHSFLQYVNYPVFIRIFMMNYKNVVIQNNAMHFNFRFFASDEQEQYTEEKFFQELGKLFALFFSAEEIGKNNKLFIVSEKCRKNLYSSVAEVIKDIEDAVGTLDQEEALKLAIVEKKKKAKALLAKAVVFLMVLAGGCLVYQRYQQEKQKSFQHNIVEEIGTVHVGETVEQSQLQENTIIHVNALRELPEKIEAETEKATQENTTQGVQNQRDRIFDTEEYTVRAGDSLYIICLEKYKDAAYVYALAEYNGIVNRNLIYPGQRLKLPSAEELGNVTQRSTAVYSNPVTTYPVQEETPAETIPEINLDEYELLLEEEDYGNAVG